MCFYYLSLAERTQQHNESWAAHPKRSTLQESCKFYYSKLLEKYDHYNYIYFCTCPFSSLLFPFLPFPSLIFPCLVFPSFSFRSLQSSRLLPSFDLPSSLFSPLLPSLFLSTPPLCLPANVAVDLPHMVCRICWAVWRRITQYLRSKNSWTMDKVFCRI